MSEKLSSPTKEKVSAVRSCFERLLPEQEELRVEVSTEGIKSASDVMARAFVGSYDPTWLRWLPTSTLIDIRNGHTEDAERRVSSSIQYMLSVFTELGGTVVTYRNVTEDGDGEILGVALHKLPGTKKEGIGTYLRAIQSTYAAFGFVRLIPAAFNYARMIGSTAERSKRLGEPLEEHIHLTLIAVDQSYGGRGIASTMMRPYLRLADEFGLSIYLESSNPQQNDAKFRRWGFGAIYEHRYALPRVLGSRALNQLTTVPPIPIMRRPAKVPGRT